MYDTASIAPQLVPPALAWDHAWHALGARLSALSARHDLGIASQLDLAERDFIREQMDALIEAIR